MLFATLHRSIAVLLVKAAALTFFFPAAHAQDSPGDRMVPRADRPEISVTVRDHAGAAISAAGSVKLLRDGMLSDETGLSRGHAFFGSILFGSYTVVVDATGYKSTQRDVNVSVAMRYEVDVTLQRDSASDSAAGAPSKPLLAPKATEALDKTWKALSKNKLSEAEKHLNEAIHLAPTHPDVQNAHGVLY